MLRLLQKESQNYSNCSNYSNSIWVIAVNDLEKEENQFLRINLEESFIVPKMSASRNDVPILEKLIIYVEMSGFEIITGTC